jgi:hypothetical protein
MSEPQLNEIIAVIAAERVAAGARYAGLVAARQRAYRRHAAAKGLLTRARKDGSAARIAAAARREAEASADAGRIGDACLREMHDLVGAALGNLLRIGQMGPAWAAGAAVIGAPGRPRSPRDTEDDADARRQVPR